MGMSRRQYAAHRGVSHTAVGKAISSGLHAIPGVVEHGLFLGMCHVAIIGKPDGTVVQLDRNADIDADMLAGEGD